MLIYKHKTEIEDYISQTKKNGKKIGFVPTMGALHQGHLALIDQAVAKTDQVVASIFVNPKQFNNSEDLNKYPRMPEKDIDLLQAQGCHAVFLPTPDEMYAGVIERTYDLGYLDTVMEAKFRPGHFNGVAFVVDLLFELVRPDIAFFGEKDFQQLAVINEMVRQKKHRVEVIACPTIRETDGLAMSSRNLRLTAEERKQAPFLYQLLKEARQQTASLTPDQIKATISNTLTKNSSFKLEYIEIVNALTLQPVSAFNNQPIQILIAAWLGSVRLIDNIQLLP